ncbi:MAG: GNAT family N-acetyltransferase [candidate division WOR-3 bacterium]|nr:MAG: GNAT family N-acetyltransferase [candidate division WOR-3 bacterium]
MIRIEQMNDSDIGFAKSLTDIEEWGHVEEDFERLYSLDPAGCYVAWLGDEKAGIVTSVTYGNHSFLGNLIVRKGMRGRGIGIDLMEKIIGHLDRKGVKTIELDGVLRAVQTYRILGFRDKYLSLRFARPPQDNPDGAQKPKAGYTGNIEEVLRFDREKTGMERGLFLRHLLEKHPHTTYTLHRQRITAYAVIRERATGGLHIGPMVAENESAANDLTISICAQHGRNELTIGVPGINAAASQMLVRHGFLHCPPSLRMYRGQRIDYESNVYAIVSADVG